MSSKIQTANSKQMVPIQNPHITWPLLVWKFKSLLFLSFLKMIKLITWQSGKLKIWTLSC